MNSFFDFNTALGADRPGKVVPFDTPEAQFRKFLLEHGLLPRAVVPTDGARVERCPVEGDIGNKKSGWYIFFNDKFPGFHKIFIPFCTAVCTSS